MPDQQPDNPNSSLSISTPSLLVPLIAAGVMFMENLDATVIVTALPTMALAFKTTTTSISLGISGYMVAVGVFIPLSAWLADRFGTRTVLCSAIALFTLSSLLCGLSTGLWEFIGMRLVQGAAAALMTPVARLVVVRNVSKSELMQAIAIITWPSLIAPVLGPPIGGFITTYATWQWIFFINLPIGLLGLVLAWRKIPQQKSQVLRPFDGLGFILMTLTLAGLIFGLELLGGNADHWALGAFGVGCGLVFGVFSIRHVKRHAHPLFSVASARIQSFAVCSFSGGALSRIAISATPFLLPLLFQIAFGYSAFVSGLMVIAYFVGNIGMKLFTTRIIRKLGFRQVFVYNGLAVAAAVLFCASLQPSSTIFAIIGLLFLGGATRSLQMTALNSMAFADVPADETSAANALFSLIQQVSMTLGVAAGAFFLNLSLSWRGGTRLSLHDFQVAFLCVGLIGLLAMFSYLRLPRTVGAEVSGHRSAHGAR